MACSANKKLVVFIVDDEPGPLQTLANDLKEMPEVGEVCTFSSYSDAVYPLITKQPDVVFLDVEVPGKSGLDFLRDIRPRISFTFHAVFYTAYSHYMIDAIRNSAFDFLLKPYKPEELRTVIDRVILAPADSVPPSSHYASKHQPGTHKLALQTISELLLVSVSEVLMLQYERQSRAWLLYLTDNSTHRLHSGIKATELLNMSSAFVQTSSGCIVNLTYLAAIENTTQRCRFCQPFEGVELYASRRYFSKLKERFEMI